MIKKQYTFTRFEEKTRFSMGKKSFREGFLKSQQATLLFQFQKLRNA